MRNTDYKNNSTIFFVQVLQRNAGNQATQHVSEIRSNYQKYRDKNDQT